jgi:hypothetical protein
MRRKGEAMLATALNAHGLNPRFSFGAAITSRRR